MNKISTNQSKLVTWFFINGNEKKIHLPSFRFSFNYTRKDSLKSKGEWHNFKQTSNLLLSSTTNKKQRSHTTAFSLLKKVSICPPLDIYSVTSDTNYLHESF